MSTTLVRQICKECHDEFSCGERWESHASLGMAIRGICDFCLETDYCVTVARNHPGAFDAFMAQHIFTIVFLFVGLCFIGLLLWTFS